MVYTASLNSEIDQQSMTCGGKYPGFGEELGFRGARKYNCSRMSGHLLPNKEVITRISLPGILCQSKKSHVAPLHI